MQVLSFRYEFIKLHYSTRIYVVQCSVNYEICTCAVLMKVNLWAQVIVVKVANTIIGSLVGVEIDYGIPWYMVSSWGKQGYMVLKNIVLENMTISRMPHYQSKQCNVLFFYSRTRRKSIVIFFTAEHPLVYLHIIDYLRCRGTYSVCFLLQKCSLYWFYWKICILLNCCSVSKPSWYRHF